MIGGLCHAELIGNCPSPMEEGVGERVQLIEKINSSFKKCAFTLAEVLITLGIIGVVAAMTIPTLVSKTTANRYRAQYKKTVATLSQAARLSQSQYDFDFAGLEGTCINPANDNPENVMTICAILNGTLTGASFHYITDLNMKNGLKYGNNISCLLYTSDAADE